MRMLNQVEKIATFYKTRVSLRVPKNMTKCGLLQVDNTLKKKSVSPLGHNNSIHSSMEF